jgi:hypothetical protein
METPFSFPLSIFYWFSIFLLSFSYHYFSSPLKCNSTEICCVVFFTMFTNFVTFSNNCGSNTTEIRVLSSVLLLVNDRHTLLEERAVRALREIVKLSSDSGDCSSKKCKRGYGAGCGGLWWCLSLAGAWSEAVSFVLVRFAGIWFQSP